MHHPHDTRPRTTRPADIGGPLLTIGEESVGSRSVLSLAGEVDISTAAELRVAIEAAASRAFELWLDLSDVRFMDSSGLHVLLGSRIHLNEANTRLALICPDGPVLRLLSLTGVDRVFEIHASRSAANHAAPA